MTKIMTNPCECLVCNCNHRAREKVCISCKLNSHDLGSLKRTT